MKRKSIPTKVRKRVYEKYGGQCAYCGEPIEYKEMQVDHMEPLAKGGADSEENYMPACVSIEIYNEKLYTARKEHRCHICGITINLNEQYYRESGKYEGDFFDRCTCICCYEVREQFIIDVNETEYSEWEILDEATNTFCEDHYETGPCACCEHKNPLHCNRVREHYENQHKKRCKQA